MMETCIYDEPGVNERLYMGFQASVQEQKWRAIETLQKFHKAFGQEKGKEGEKKEIDGKEKDQGKKGRGGKKGHEGLKK
jgi:hypothetical protein